MKAKTWVVNFDGLGDIQSFNFAGGGSIMVISRTHTPIYLVTPDNDEIKFDMVGLVWSPAGGFHRVAVKNGSTAANSSITLLLVDGNLSKGL